KSDVFNFAACHASDDERDGFVERARFFFNYSTTTLPQMPTRTLARPVIVLMTSGTLQSYRALHPGLRALAPSTEPPDYGVPMAFVPQRERVKRRLAAIAAALSLLGLACIAYSIVG